MPDHSRLIADDHLDDHPGEDGPSPTPGAPLADAPLAVPVYWLALFDEADLARDGAGAGAGPSLATGLEAARERFGLRRGLLAARFPEFDPDWEWFDALLAGVEARTLRVEVAGRLLAGDGDAFERVQSAVRWFESRDEEDFEQLLAVAAIGGYDLARRTFPDPGGSASRAAFLLGRPIVDPGP